jgi:hypothetical protein
MRSNARSPLGTSGAMLLIGNNEIVFVSDGKIRFELT